MTVIAELGHFALALALAASLAQAGLLLAGARRHDAVWLAAGRHAATAGSLLVLGAFGALSASFLANDFSLRAVASHSHPGMPGPYRVAAAWGGPGGTMLLWSAMLASWTLALRLVPGRLPLALACRALGYLGLVAAGLVAATLATANPFARGAAIAAAGHGLDPLLQDPAMLLHAPLLVAGGAGLAVAFALSIAALAGDRLDAVWARSSRPWALGAWVFLTAGIGLGSLWADGEPAWGEWWSWDRLQGASLVTWLAATALVHALPVAEKRGIFRRWTALLAILAFAAALLGAWLAGPEAPGLVPDRDPGAAQAGAFLLLFAIVAGAGLALLAQRGPDWEHEGPFEMISREAALAANGMVFLSALAVVLVGLLQPYLVAALGTGRGVGASYFNSVFVPLIVPGLALMGPAPRMRWSSESGREALRDAIRPACAGFAAATAAAMLFERETAWTVVAVFLSAWIAAHGIEAIAFRLRRTLADGAGPGDASRAASFYAMHASHFGMALIVAGAALSAVLEQSAEVVVVPRGTESAGFLRVRAEGAREVEGANYRAVRLRLVVTEDGRESVVEPELRFYGAGGLRTAESAVHRGLARDLHVHVVRPAGGGAWVVRVRTRPLMSLVWAGMALTLAGGLLALADRRFRALSPSAGARFDAAPAVAVGGAR
ncbi:MAG: cytochrome c biogenesis protein CcsA [Lysobacter sp.]|nr:cytochrome c biogenesis protein CcsA [Lysobacter sp.]